jgi:hypothetical protein
MITVKKFIDRLKFRTDNQDTIELYRKMYIEKLNNDVYNDENNNGLLTDDDVKDIVYNDYISRCTVIDNSDPNFKKIMELALKGGFYNRYLKYKNLFYHYIEAFNEDKGLILVSFY